MNSLGKSESKRNEFIAERDSESQIKIRHDIHFYGGEVFKPSQLKQEITSQVYYDVLQIMFMNYSKSQSF